MARQAPAQQSTDRFEREARVIASLNHTNICTLYDVGPNYLVMELIEGPTLADRVAPNGKPGPIPLDEALGIAKQIAAALPDSDSTASATRTEILYAVGMAVETTYSNLRQNLASVLARSDSDNEVFVVRRRKGRDIALIPADELSGILETAHLLRSPANARRLLKALRRADARQTAASTIEQLRRDVGVEAD